MAIKSEVIEQQKPEAKPFPKLMIVEDRLIILATGYSESGYIGTLVSSTYTTYDIGHTGNWSLDFVDYDGTITLSNE